MELNKEQLEARLEQLRDQQKKIKNSCENWFTCTDGSYEMALDSYGYYENSKEIGEILDKLENV